MYVVFHSQTPSQESEFEEKWHKEDKQKCGQVRMCIIGEHLPTATAVVRTVSHKYIFTDPIKALECCFKIFMALETEYPRASDHLWEFVQKCLFNVYTIFDKNYTTVTSFMNSIDM